MNSSKLASLRKSITSVIPRSLQRGDSFLKYWEVADMNRNNVTAEKCKKVLENFIDEYKKPVFGVLPKKQIDILVVDMMLEIGLLPKRPAIFDLVHKLKITQAKAQSLIYELGLRKLGVGSLQDDLVDTLFIKSNIQRQGDLVCFDIENPLLIDYLRERLRGLKHTLDKSFSPTLVKLSIDALAALMDSMVSDSDKERYLADFQKRNVPVATFHNLMKGAALKFIEKYAGKEGVAFAEKHGEKGVATLFKSGCKLTGFWADFFKSWNGDTE